jgi:hypothetical protein
VSGLLLVTNLWLLKTARTVVGEVKVEVAGPVKAHDFSFPKTKTADCSSAVHLRGQRMSNSRQVNLLEPIVKTKTLHELAFPRTNRPILFDTKGISQGQIWRQ